MPQKRQLAAIMFTDIEGYTALMQNDEGIALSLRDKHRSIFDSSMTAFQGEVVQYFGDGTLSVFKSTVEAIECAIELQLAFIREKIPVRIGIHVGDIVYSKEDIVGDAVNVASRIESCAIAGSILISDKVHDQIRSHRHIQSKFLDAYDLKNVDHALPIFCIINDGLAVPDPREIRGKLKAGKQIEKFAKRGRKRSLALGLVLGVIAMIVVYFQYVKPVEKPTELSIAVLPFENLSTDTDSEIFRDGITEDILSQLSKINDLRVISRTSAAKYKNTNKTIPEIAKELGVSLILEGSIRKYGDKVKVNTQLINAENDERIWGDDYDRTLVDIFAIQTEISEEIVDALQLNLSFEEQQSLATIPTKNIEAYKLFLQGRKEADKRNSESLAKSISLYEKALELDPNYAEALAEIANSIYLETYYSFRDPEEAATTANTYLDKAEAISEKVSRIYSVRGLIYNIQGKTEEAKKAFEKAIQLSPNDVTAHYHFATFYFYRAQPKQQLEQAEIAYRLDPLSFVTANSYFTALVENREFDQAENLMKTVEKSSDGNNQFVIDRAFFRLYTSKGDYKSAIPPLQKLVVEENAFNRFLAYSYGKIGDTVNAYKTIELIKTLDIDEDDGKSHQLAVAFAGLKEIDSVFFYLDTIRNNRSALLYREIPAFLDIIREDPRYPDLLKAHNLEDD
ncbi:MAG: adenylate/guanylate cyclase domain-containing protein [Bacteroidota bacterium]